MKTTTTQSTRVPWAWHVAAALVLLAYFRLVHFSAFDHDEVEHAHFSWLVLQGQVPYVDFHQNHLPALWLLGAAVLSVMPESLAAVLTLRWLCALSFLVALLAGCRHVKRMAPDAATTIYPLTVIVAVAFAVHFEWYRLRPDPFMSLLCTAALVVAAKDRFLTHSRAAFLGVLIGAAACFSLKMWPLGLLLPLLVVGNAWTSRRAALLAPLVSYAIGGALALLPLFSWLAATGLLTAFFEDVVAFNAAYRKPLQASAGALSSPLVIAAMAGALALALPRWSRAVTNRWSATATAIAIALGVSITFSTVHGHAYNLQCATIPAAVAVACLALVLAESVPWPRARPVALALIVTLTLATTMQRLVDLRQPGWTILQVDLRELIALAHAAPPDATCVGFAPYHPIFCQDATGLALGWDVSFLRHPSPYFRERQQRIWTSAIEAIERGEPELVIGAGVRAFDPWKRAQGMGAFPAATIPAMLRSLPEHYEAIPLRSGITMWKRSAAAQLRQRSAQ